MTLAKDELNQSLPDTLRQPSEIERYRPGLLMSFLPAIYAGDDFMRRFLFIFEDTLKPLLRQVDSLHYYFNPLFTPPEMLDWLAGWVSLVMDESWPLEKRRKLVHAAVDLYGRRGTKAGLTEYIQLYTGVEPHITEYVDGMTLGSETQLGINTMIAGRETFSFTVTLNLSNIEQAEMSRIEAKVRQIIEAEKPAHTAYRLVIISKAAASPSAKAAEEVSKS